MSIIKEEKKIDPNSNSLITINNAIERKQNDAIEFIYQSLRIDNIFVKILISYNHQRANQMAEGSECKTHNPLASQE